MAQKRVHVRAHEFDCLPGHIEIEATGTGSSLRVALSRAVQDIAADEKLRGRRPHVFKMTVFVATEP